MQKSLRRLGHASALSCVLAMFGLVFVSCQATGDTESQVVLPVAKGFGELTELGSIVSIELHADRKGRIGDHPWSLSHPESLDKREIKRLVSQGGDYRPGDPAEFEEFAQVKNTFPIMYLRRSGHLDLATNVVIKADANVAAPDILRTIDLLAASVDASSWWWHPPRFLSIYFAVHPPIDEPSSESVAVHAVPVLFLPISKHPEGSPAGSAASSCGLLVGGKPSPLGMPAQLFVSVAALGNGLFLVGVANPGGSVFRSPEAHPTFGNLPNYAYTPDSWLTYASEDLRPTDVRGDTYHSADNLRMEQVVDKLARRIQRHPEMSMEEAYDRTKKEEGSVPVMFSTYEEAADAARMIATETARLNGPRIPVGKVFLHLDGLDLTHQDLISAISILHSAGVKAYWIRCISEERWKRAQIWQLPEEDAGESPGGAKDGLKDDK